MRIGRVGGAEQATYQLIDALAQVDKRNHYNLRAPRSTYFDFNFPKDFNHSVTFTDRVEKVLRDQRKGRTSVKALSRKHLLHAPSGYLNDELKWDKLVVTIHDLQHLTFPHYFTSDELIYRDRQLARITACADHIIAISNFTKGELIRHYNIPEERISVIWISPDPKFAIKPGKRNLLSFRKQLELRKPFVIYPAYPWAHKNHLRLLQAWRALKQGREVSDHQLILTGKPLDSTHPAYSTLKESIRQGDVIHLGYRSPREIRLLYHAADALVFPSEFEGFGLPITEAFAAGLPVLSSNAASLPEIGGDAVLFFDCNDTESLAKSIAQIVNDSRLRTSLRQKGLERATLFHPRITAIRTLTVYSKFLHDFQSAPTYETPSPSARPLPISRRFEWFRHFASLSEKSARNKNWPAMIFAAFLAFIHAPHIAFKRLGGGAQSHILAWWSQRRTTEEIPAKKG